MARYEWRAGWEASSNASFTGMSDWEPWEGDEETVDEVENAIDRGGAVSIGLESVINSSGFGWWAEVREAEGVRDAGH